MIDTMNDYDFEEKKLLNSLNDFGNHQHQYPYLGMTNVNTNNINNNTNYYHSNHQRNVPYQQQYFDLQQQHCEQHLSENNNSSSTVSMSTEEDAFDDFKLFDDDQDDMHDMNSGNVDARLTFSIENTTQKGEKLPKSSRRIPLDDNDKDQSKQRKVQNKHNNCKESHITNEGTMVEEPTDNDVLCGQSRTCSNHPGNKHFQEVLESFSYRYDIASSKQEKMCMTKEIVSIIHNTGGRFLRLKSKMWEEISTVAARDKVSHALRTKAASHKRRREQMLQSDNLRGYPPSPPTSRKSRSPSHSRRSIKQHRRTSQSRPSSAPSLSEFDPISLHAPPSSTVIDNLMKSTHDMFATLTTPATTVSTLKPNHRRSVSQPKTFEAEDLSELFFRSDSALYRHRRF